MEMLVDICNVWMFYRHLNKHIPFKHNEELNRLEVPKTSLPCVYQVSFRYTKFVNILTILHFHDKTALVSIMTYSQETDHIFDLNQKLIRKQTRPLYSDPLISMWYQLV